MLIWDRELTEMELTHNKKTLNNANIIDFLKGDNLLDVYENLGLFIKGNRGSYTWSIGIEINNDLKNRLNKLYRESSKIKEDIYYKCRKMIMKGVKYSEDKNIEDLNFNQRQIFKESMEKAIVAKINELQEAM